MYSYAKIVENSKKYPEFVRKDEFCEMCGICPRTAARALKSGTVAYTKRYARAQGPRREYLVHYYDIAVKDILRYAKDKCSLSECQESDLEKIKLFYIREFENLPDMLQSTEVSKVIGYGKEAIRRWIISGLLVGVRRKEKFYVAKEDLILFLLSDHYRNIVRKSDIHIKRDNLIKEIL